MRGQIDILVATQYIDGKFVQIFRSLYYTYTPGDLIKPRTDVAKIYWLLKDNLSKINVDVEHHDTEGILQNIAHMDIIYTKLPENLNIVQERMPRMLISFYEKIESHTFNLDRLIKVHTTELLDLLISTKQLLHDAKMRIMTFWKERPEIFLRLPMRIICDEMTIDLFQSERYLPYILGRSLPLWNDPVTISIMNETRKRIQGRDQREDYFVLLRSIARDFDCWTIKRIVEYLPILFDLMVSQTPWEFSLGKSRDECDISVWVS